MPRSSRHRSHRSRKHSRDRSVSEDEDDVPRDKRPREEEPAASSSVRVSRDPESEKRISTRTPEGKDAGGLNNGDASSEHGKKRRGRVEDATDATDNDRWIGGEDEDYKRAKAEDIALDKNSKSKHVAADLKGRSSRRGEGSSERNDDSLGKFESVRRKAEKDSSRRDSSSGLHRDVKEDRERGSDRDRERVRERITGRDKERAEREQERDSERGRCGVSEKERERASQKERNWEREAHDAGYENSDILRNKKRSSKVESNEEERLSKKDVNINELQVQDVMPNTELEKRVDKHMRDGSEDDKWLHDVRDGDDKRLYSRDDHPKHRSYRDERHEDGKYKDKKLDDFDRDHRHRDDKRRDDRSRDRASERSESKSFRDDVKILDSRYRKTKQDNDNEYDGVPFVDDRNIKSKDYRGRNRFSDEFEDYSEFKHRIGKEQQKDADKNVLTRTDSQMDKSRSDYRNSDKFDSSLRSNWQKTASSSNAYPMKDQSRDSSKQAESGWKESSSEDRSRPSASRSTSGVHERVSFSRSERVKHKADIHSAEIYVEAAVSAKYERTPMSDTHISPNQRRERSSSISDRRLSDRTGARHSFDTEVAQKNNLKDRDRDRAENAVLDDLSHNDACNRESTPAGSSINRSGHFTGNSPNHMFPPPAMRLASDSPSVLGSYEDERSQVGDRKSYSRYKRSGDLAFGRGHLNAWKNAPSWHSPLGNGFIPLQHGVPPAGFHPPVAQFPGPPLFGVRPPMDLAHGGISYNMHDVADSFHGHGRPFGWHNAVDQTCPPHMQLWDGSNAVFGDEPHMYGRPDWDHNRHLLGTRGWGMNAELWKSQSSSMSVDFPTPKKEQECLVDPLADETQITQQGHQTQNDKAQAHLECMPTESIEAKHSGDSPSDNNASDGPQRQQNKKKYESSKLSGNQSANFISNYISRLDISPLLAGSDLFEKCTSLCAPSVTDQRHFQNDKGCGWRKLNDRRDIMRSFRPKTNESVFQSAISLYKKQNESSKVKLHIPVICSGEKKEPAEDPGKGDGQVGQQNKFLEKDDVGKTPLPDDVGATSKMETEDDTTINTPDDAGATNMETEDDITTHADFHPSEADDKRPNFCSGAVFSANDPQACDSPTEEIRVNLSRIPNSPESTH